MAAVQSTSSAVVAHAITAKASASLPSRLSTISCPASCNAVGRGLSSRRSKSPSLIVTPKLSKPLLKVSANANPRWTRPYRNATSARLHPSSVSNRLKSTRMPMNSVPSAPNWPIVSMTKDARYCIWLRAEMLA